MIPNRSFASAAPLLAALLATCSAAGCWRPESAGSRCAGPADERSCVRIDATRAANAAAGDGELARDHGSGQAGRGVSPAGGGGGRAGGTGTGQDGSMLAAGDEPAVAGPRSVLVGAVVNARDLGGIPLTDDAAVADGVLFRGPPLANLSSDGCEQVAALGVRTVIDLREEAERTSKPSAPCVQEQAASVLAPLPIPYSVSPTDYLADLNTDTSMVEVFRTLGDADAYPVYFHCTWGRDRTAVLAAVILLALGADRDAIMDDYLLSRATVGAYPESLEAVLDEVEARGGVDAFLTDAGVDEEWVATLRATAVSAP